jgi:hypothetical protein
VCGSGSAEGTAPRLFFCTLILQCAKGAGTGLVPGESRDERRRQGFRNYVRTLYNPTHALDDDSELWEARRWPDRSGLSRGSTGAGRLRFRAAFIADAGPNPGPNRHASCSSASHRDRGDTTFGDAKDTHPYLDAYRHP